MKKKKSIIDLMIVILAGVMIFSGYKVFEIRRDAKEARQQYQQLEQLVSAEKTPDSANSYITTSQQKYSAIYQQNSDFVGWIYIPDTVLSYPVMHTPSNPEYYLRRNFTGKYSVHGVPFIDYKCVVDQSDNTIIYGHNMTNGTMFSVVEDYGDKDYYLQHRYIGFDTMNGYGTYEVALCARIDLQTTDFNYIDTVDFDTKEDFDSYIEQFKAISCYDTDVQLCYGDKLILLSTCESNYKSGRYVIIAKKISDNDLSSVNQ